MKSIFTLAVLILAGCGERSNLMPDAKLNEPVVTKDSETGCEYLSPTTAGFAMVPRVDRNGKHICR